MIGISQSCCRLWRSRRAMLGVLVLLNWLAFSTASRANTLVSLVPTPTSAAFPAFTFSGTSFAAGSGSVGNGDGNLPVMSQTPGGLQLQTPFYIFPLTFGQQVDADGSTYYDTTLVLSNLSAAGSASQFTQFGVPFDAQALTNGTFAIYGSLNQPGGVAANGTSGAQLLLAGSLSNNEIYGPDGTTSAAVFSTQVTYNSGPAGGLIGEALSSDGGSLTDDASFNLSLTNLSSFGINGMTGELNPFTAGGTVLFNANFAPPPPPPVPEPSSVALMGLGILALAIVALRRRLPKFRAARAAAGAI